MNAVISVNDLIVPEFAILGLLALVATVWGFRHGLDTVLIAAGFVMFGRLSSDVLAVPVSIIINVVYGFLALIASGQFSASAFANTVFGSGGGQQLIDPNNSGDQIFVIISTVIFLAIGYIGVKFAVKRAGGQDSFIEAVFGAIGGGAMAYLTFGYAINRVIALPTSIQITPTNVPQLTVNMPLIVALVMVLIVFGVQRSRPPAKKK